MSQEHFRDQIRRRPAHVPQEDGLEFTFHDGFCTLIMDGNPSTIPARHSLRISRQFDLAHQLEEIPTKGRSR